MQKDTGLTLSSLRVDGGACANDFLMQFQADILGTEVLRPKCIETTSLGAAYLAGLAVGYWKDKNEIANNWAIDKSFSPTISSLEAEALLKGWHKAVDRTRDWAEA